MNPFTTNSQKITRTNKLEIPEEIFAVFMFQLLHKSLVQSELFSPLIYRPNPKFMLSAFSSIPSPL